MVAADWLGREGRMDRLAMGLSGLCLVHCVGTALFFASIASVGGLFHAHWVHEVGLFLAIGFALVALARGVFAHGFLLPFGVGCFGLGMMGGALALPHGGDELLATMVGVLIVAFGHDLNQRAAR
ncbi:MAG: MerC domain-containing protein [Sphingopyxis sp.]|nr:MerC domain-containing protein [Sphingopyxis sp.]